MLPSNMPLFYDDSSSSALSRDTVLEPIRPLTANPAKISRTRSIGNTWRRRRKSLVLHLGDGYVREQQENAHKSAMDDETSPADMHHDHDTAAKPGMTMTGKIRRASMSLMRGIIHHRDRRSSEPGSSQATASPENIHQQRQTTSHGHGTWRKLRSVTSFNKHSTPLETIYSPLRANFDNAPAHQNGIEPPIIPAGGAAAKAAAAIQNEFLAYHRDEWMEHWLYDDVESGIGIAMTTTPEETGLSDNMAGDLSICKVDFIAQLPSELAIQVLAHLDAANLAAAARVSKGWNQVVRDQYIWRQSFLREKTSAFAIGKVVEAGKGLGVPPIRPGNDWRKIYRARHELDKKWRDGHRARAVYLNGHIDSIYCLQFDESKIITGSRDKTLRIWDMHTFECRLVIGPAEVVNDMSILFDVNGRPVHYASTPESDRAHESVPATVSFPIHHKASVLCLQYDETMLVTGSSDSTCIVYSIKAGYRPIRRLQHHTAAVLDLAFDDKHIVTCSKDITICVWDRNTGTLLKQLKGHTGPVNAVQLRGNTIVSCSGDFRVMLWNLDSGKVVREFLGHTKGLACSQFSEDGRYIASAGSDKVIRVWDAVTGDCIHELPAHENLVRSLHIDSVSGRLISGSYDTDIKVFDMETGRGLLDFPKWHESWVLSAKSDYRRIVSTGQDPKILIQDFGASIQDISMLESVPQEDVAKRAGFL